LRGRRTGVSVSGNIANAFGKNGDKSVHRRWNHSLEVQNKLQDKKIEIAQIEIMQIGEQTDNLKE
jgi:hypothetical protein